MDFSKVIGNLRDRGYSVHEFGTAAEASRWIDGEIDGCTVGFGGSETLTEMGLYDILSAHNMVYSHHVPKDGMTTGELRAAASGADIYLSSVNGLSENGEIINIDAQGNRVSSTLYGHRRVFLVIGENKLAPDHDKALWRARNIAGPLNARRLGRKTPCAVKADRCYDCRSPERICRELVVLWQCPIGMDIDIVLIHEKLGY